MGRKKVIKIPTSAKITCPNCNKNTIIKVERDSSPQFFECKKCKQKASIPITKCCVICAFSNKNCVHSLLLEAHNKGLLVKEPMQREEKINTEESINRQIKEGFGRNTENI